MFYLIGKNKLNDSFGDPNFVEADSPTAEISTKDLTSLLDEDIQVQIINSNKTTEEHNKYWDEAAALLKSDLHALFDISARRGRQEGLKSLDTPCFD